MILEGTILEPVELLEVLKEGRRDEFKSLLRTQPETVLDAAFEDASREERLEFLRLMPVERAANTFTDLSLEDQGDFLTDLSSDRIRVMGAFFGPDEMADLLGELSSNADVRAYLISSLPPTLAKSALELELYPDDDAGGMMTPEFVAVREGWSVGHSIQFLRQAADHAETVQNLYLVNAIGQLRGIIPLQALITASAITKVEDLARLEIIFAKTDTDQQEVARLMRDYDLAVMPIVDESGVLKGIVTIDDVIDVLEEEATEDIYKGVAMEGSEIDYLRTSPVVLWRKRVLWLAGLSISEFLTVNVTSSYDGLLKDHRVLAFFTAALVGTGGNTGSQSAVLVIRAISKGQIRGRDAIRVLFKEFSTGLLLGITLGIFAFARVYIVYPTAGVGIAMAVSLAVLAIVLTANIVGALLPIAFFKLKIDPAVTSSPFLATIMDATGLLIYFSIAQLVLRFL
jgi:magnesium transporter